ncbi:hypothetical protein T01_3636 [Trichinella spiralis]|uniref:Uncharacterized protein n=1 Tax=Trichinella spiralis TaxID=6334 RepID=A0A0V1BV68_TRISP|nr:hypothetical protein T01_3636 [Trichinella spiralis]
MISGLTDLVIDPLEIFTRAARASKTKAYSGQPSGIQQVVQGNVPKPCGSVENDSELNLSGAPLLIHSMMRQIAIQLPLDQAEPLLSDRVIIWQGTAVPSPKKRTAYRTPLNESFRSNSFRSKPDRDCSSSEEIPMASSSQNFRSSWSHSVSADLSAGTVVDGSCAGVYGPLITHLRQVSTATGSLSPARTIVDPSILKK